MTGGAADRASMVRRIGPREFDFAREVAVMAIVNRTPDSFYDKGRTDALDAAVAAAHRAIDEGADWIDVGGAKFAPGPAIPVGRRSSASCRSSPHSPARAPSSRSTPSTPRSRGRRWRRGRTS